MRDHSESYGRAHYRRAGGRCYEEEYNGKQGWSRDSRWNTSGSGSMRTGLRERDYERYYERDYERDRGHRVDRYPRGGGDDRHCSRDSRGCGRGGGGEIEITSPCIWIGGCPNDITEREIERVCSKFGPVQNISIKHSSRDTFVFAHFGRVSHAREAIRGLDQVMAFGAGVIKVAPANRKVDGRNDAPRDTRPPRSDYSGRRGEGRVEPRVEPRMEPRRERTQARSPPPLPHVRRSRSRRAMAPRRVRVYLSQLPRDMEEDELQEIAGEYGNVLQYELHREGAYKCGWVEYASKAEALAAVDELNDRRMDEWNMHLQAYIYPGGAP